MKTFNDVLNTAITIYKKMESTRFFATLRSSKPDLDYLQKIYDMDLFSTNLKQLNTELSILQKKTTQTNRNSKFKYIIDILLLCASVANNTEDVQNVLRQFELLKLSVEKQFTGWTNTDPDFIKEYKTLVELATEFIKQYANNEQLDLISKQITLSNTEKNLTSEQERLNKNAKQLEAIDQVLQTLQETLLREKLEAEKSELIKTLRTQQTQIELYKQEKTKKENELQEAYEKLKIQENKSIEEHNELLKQNKALVFTVQELEQKLKTKSNYYLLSETENINKTDIDKLKELRRSESDFENKYNRVIQLAQGNQYELADVIYHRYKNAYSSIFQDNKIQLYSATEEEAFKTRCEIDCVNLSKEINQFYLLMPVATTMNKISEPNPKIKDEFINKVESLSGAQKAMAEFAEEAIKRIENITKDRVKDWTTRLGNFAIRNIDKLDNDIKKDIQKQLQENKEMQKNKGFTNIPSLVK